jgi:hypothetical protein
MTSDFLFTKWHFVFRRSEERRRSLDTTQDIADTARLTTLPVNSRGVWGRAPVLQDSGGPPLPVINPTRPESSPRRLHRLPLPPSFGFLYHHRRVLKEEEKQRETAINIIAIFFPLSVRTPSPVVHCLPEEAPPRKDGPRPEELKKNKLFDSSRLVLLLLRRL